MKLFSDPSYVRLSFAGEFIWSELRENEMMNPAPGFWTIFGPLGPTAGSGSPGNAPARKIVQVTSKISPGDQF